MYNLYFKYKEKYCCRKGQGIIEYVLLVALIALVLIASITLFGDSIGNAFNSISNVVRDS